MALPLNQPLLIVEDSDTALQVIEELARSIGFTTILSAKDGMEALAKLEVQRTLTPPQPVGLILADWNMPSMSGIELLKAIRSSEQYKATPFIMITADSEMDMIVQAISAGVNSYIVKPVTAEGLRTKIASVFTAK